MWISFLILSLFFVTLIPDSYAITKTWIGGDDIWHDDLNWSPTGVPAFNDEVLIDGGNPAISVVHIDSDLVRGGDTIISNGDTLIIDNGVTFHPDASVTVEVGGLILNSGTTFHTSQLFNSGTVRNFGSYSISSSTNNGVISNQVDGIFEFDNFIKNTGTITNIGTLSISSGALRNIGTIDNQGTLDNAVELSNWGQFTNTGTVTQSTGTVFNRCSGTITNAGSFSGTIDENSGLPPPFLIDWIIIKNCILEATDVAQANVIVQNNSVLTIPNGLTLNIDFTTNNLTVQSGSGVLIKAGGTIT